MIIINKYWIYNAKDEQSKFEIMDDIYYIKAYFDSIIKNMDTPIDKILENKVEI